MKHTELVLSALAVLGTLAGVFFGYQGAIRSVHLQLEHEDRTRYQEQRLETYTSFLDNANSLVAFGNYERPLSNAQQQVFAEVITAFNTSFRRLQLAAGPKVRKLAHEVHALVLPFARGEHKMEDRSAAQERYVSKLRDLLQAMRLELGTESKPDVESSE